MSNIPANKENIRWGDWLSAFLLIISMQIAAGRLIATRWTEELQLVQLITLYGTVLGLALGRSIFKRFWVIFFSLAYGLFVIPWQIGLTIEHEIIWRDRLINLWGRLGVIVQALLTQNPVTDNLLFLFLMAILFWSLSVYAGFSLVREGNPWKVVIPGGITAFIIHSFDPLLISRSWYLASYIFFALLLIARMVYLQNIAKWRGNHIHTPPDIGFDFTRVVLISTLVLVIFSWNVPVLAQTFKPAAEIWRTAARPWLNTKDRFSFMFASLRASVGLVQNFYGNTLPLGLGSPLSDQVILEVEAPTNPPNGYRYYWEARSYNIYESSQWQTNLKTAHELNPESEDLNQPGADIRSEITATFFPHTPISNLYVLSEPLWVNRPTQAYMTINPDGLVNLGALMSKSFIHPGEQYSVRSVIDSMTEIELSGAGTDYPQWVLDEYLKLPNDITPRTKELANEIATGLSNPYDIAIAVTEYLRNNIEYEQAIKQPPKNQERIDWFLFDYRKGFCNYYASAEVILLRSLGIPARMAVGFAQGERKIHPIEEQVPGGIVPGFTNEQISDIATYVVRQKDAHAWPEVYFPGRGWVIFEPTVSQPILNRPSGLINNNSNQDRTRNNLDDSKYLQELNTPERQTPDSLANTQNSGAGSGFWMLTNIIKYFILLLSLTMLVIIVLLVRKGFRVMPFLEQISIGLPEGMVKGFHKAGIRPPNFLLNWIFYVKLPNLSRSYMEINHALKRIGKNPSIQDTPAERAIALIQAIPGAASPAGSLLSEYQTSEYSPYQANPEIARKAGNEIRKLSWLARLGKFLTRFQ
jgi:transglutaminase-like putative cysteine protease